MEPIQRSCERCGSVFTILFARHKRQRFCSVTCSANARPVKNSAARFWALVTKGDAGVCWPWKGAHTEAGYGCFYFRKRVTPAHRVSWMLTNGEIPGGLVVMHSCDNPRCVNPHHLSVGTYADNNLDMVRKGRHAGKLTKEDVLAIRSDTRLHRLIAADFGVSRTMVSNIKRGDACKWVAA